MLRYCQRIIAQSDATLCSEINQCWKIRERHCHNLWNIAEKGSFYNRRSKFMAESLDEMAKRAERIIQGECENSNVRMLDLGGGANTRNLGIAVVTGTYNPDTNTILLAAVCKGTDITVPPKSEENLPMAPQDKNKSKKTKERKKRNGRKSNKKEVIRNITERRESVRIRQRMETTKEGQTRMEGNVGGDNMQPSKSQDYEVSHASEAKPAKEKMDQNDTTDKNNTEHREEGIKTKKTVEEPMKLRSHECKEKITHVESTEKDPKDGKQLKDLRVVIEKFEPVKKSKPMELRDRKKNQKRGGKKNERKEANNKKDTNKEEPSNEEPKNKEPNKEPAVQDEPLELKNRENRASERLGAKKKQINDLTAKTKPSSSM